jgi:hypothetical protein
MIQPATLIEREAVGGQKNGHLLLLRRLEATVAPANATKWTKLVKREVVVEVDAEMILMLKIVVFVVDYGGGGVLEWGMQLAFPQLALITRALYRPFQALFHFTINF